MKAVSTLFPLLLLFSSCINPNHSEQHQEVKFSISDMPVLKEVYETSRDEAFNVDSPAVWHGPDNQNLLFATAKEGHSILVFDAETGEYISQIGSEGQGKLQFQRPNGIWVLNDLLMVVERDNARIQIIQLPDYKFIGFITHEDLRYPYGLAADELSDGSFEMFVTDNYNPALEGYPLEEELDERIHHYRFSVSEDGVLDFETVRLFGDISGEGILHKVESIYIDRTYNRLFIADEAYSQRSLKIYNLEGEFTGEVIPSNYFTSEPEGIAIYSCEDGSGYLIATDQHKTDENKFQVFDRETLNYMGGFRGEITRNTDGIWLTQKNFGPFDMGLFHAVHDDGSVAAFSWKDIADALSLNKQCTMN